MNCAELSRLLDEHRVDGLSRAEEASIEDHLRECPRCAAVWQANEWLAGEPPAEVPHGALDRMRRALESSDRNALEAGRGSTVRKIAGPLGLAASLLVAVGASWQWSMLPNPAGAGSDGLPPSARDAAAVFPAAAPSRFTEGEHYTLIDGARPSMDGMPSTGGAPSMDDTAPMAVEFYFMYGCGHCYAFEKIFDPWMASQSGVARIAHVPALFNPVARLHARAFYAADLLGVGPEMHRAMFRAIHERDLPMASEADLAGLAMTFGIDPDEYLRVLRSGEVRERVAAAEARNREFAVSATPTLIVGERYRILPGTAGSYEDMLAVADQIIAESGDFCRAAESGDGRGPCAGRTTRP